MLTAAICGVGSSVAYLGVAGGYAVTPASLNEFVRITLPSAIGFQPEADTMIAEEAPSLYGEAAAGQRIELAAAGNPLAATTDAIPPDEAAGTTLLSHPDPSLEMRGLTSLAAVRYDLAGGAMSSNAIQTEKKIDVGGAAQTRIKVRIDENSTIYLDAGALSALLPSRTIPQSETGFISFDQLRSEGVAVRYDAALDTIQLRPDGA